MKRIKLWIFAVCTGLAVLLIADHGVRHSCIPCMYVRCQYPARVCSPSARCCTGTCTGFGEVSCRATGLFLSGTSVVPAAAAHTPLHWPGHRKDDRHLPSLNSAAQYGGLYLHSRKQASGDTLQSDGIRIMSDDDIRAHL